jgi:hypothetical protein
MRRADLAHRLRRNAHDKATPCKRAFRLQHTGALFLRPVEGDGGGIVVAASQPEGGHYDHR